MQVDEDSDVEFCGRAWHSVGQKSESMASDKVRVVTGMNMNERRGDRPLPLVPRICQVPGGRTRTLTLTLTLIRRSAR